MWFISYLRNLQKEYRRIAAESHHCEVDAKGLFQRCWRKMVEHSQTYSLRDDVFMSRGRVWHHCPNCPVLERQALNDHPVSHCATCASMPAPPDVLHAQSCRTLNDDVLHPSWDDPLRRPHAGTNFCVFILFASFSKPTSVPVLPCCGRLFPVFLVLHSF